MRIDVHAAGIGFVDTRHLEKAEIIMDERQRVIGC